MQAATSIVEAQGWRGLYRGNALNVLRSAPQKALDFFAFDAFKRLLMGGGGGAGQAADEGEGRNAVAMKTFVAAGLAGEPLPRTGVVGVGVGEGRAKAGLGRCDREELGLRRRTSCMRRP